MRRALPHLFTLACFCLILMPSFAAAQDTGDDHARRFPDAFGVPSAFPAPGGSGYVGLSLVAPRRDLPAGTTGVLRTDGDLGAGYTIGSPVNGISVSFHVLVTSLTNTFGDSGAFAIDVARALHEGERSATFIGATASNLGAWGDAKIDPEAYSIYVSHLNAIPSARGEFPIQITFGYGDRTTYDKTGTRIGEGAFIGFGIGLTEHLSAGLSATKTQLNAGVSFDLPRLPNWGFSLGVYDVTDSVNSRQVSFSISRGF